MKPFIRRRPPHFGIDITPLMDVMFMLLIFFVLTSAFLQPGLPLKLPRAETAEEPREADMTISVEADGRCYLNNEPSTIEGIRGSLVRLAADKPSAVVVLQGDERVPYGELFPFLSAAREAGIASIDLSYEKSRP